MKTLLKEQAMKNRKQAEIATLSDEFPVRPKELTEALRNAEKRLKYEVDQLRKDEAIEKELNAFHDERNAIEAKQRAETAKYIAALEEKDRKLKGAA